jgi:hypothetical protein
VGSKVVSLAFSPDGRTLAGGTAERGCWASQRDALSGRPRGDPAPFKDPVLFLAFCPDRSALVAGSSDGIVLVLETATGRVRAELRADGPLHGVSISPDGRLILTSCELGNRSEARLWDAHTGAPASPAMTRPSHSGLAPAFRPDGSAFAVAYADGTVRLWDVATARPLGPVGAVRNECLALAFRPDGRSIVAVEWPGIVHAWPVPEPAAGPVEDVVRHVRLRTDRRIDPGRSLVALSPEEWRRLRAEGGESPGGSAEADDWDWHETMARDAEAGRDGYGLRWHLDRTIAARPGDGLLHARRARAAMWLGDVASAEADLDRDVALGPRDRVLAWMFHRAENLRDEGCPADESRLLDRVIAAGSVA